MNFPFVQQIVDLISLNAAWAGPLAFLISLAASVLGPSFFIPAASILVAAGVMVGANVLSWTIVLWAACGAGLGTLVSYCLGVWVGPRLQRTWPLKTRPEVGERANALFRRYGFLAVFIGYFYGPLRAPIAFVSGVAGMEHLRFEYANISGALLWSLTAVGQGAVFGILVGADRTLLLATIFAAPVITISLSTLAAFLWRRWTIRRSAPAVGVGRKPLPQFTIAGVSKTATGMWRRISGQRPGSVLLQAALGIVSVLVVAWIVVWATLKPLQPMLGPEGWTQKFAPLNEVRSELPPFYKFEGETKLWRNWMPGLPAAWNGEMWSVPFPAVRNLGIPIQGSARRDFGSQVLVECLADGKRHQFSRLFTYDKWAFVLVDAAKICQGWMRVGAVVTSNRIAGIGTPVRVSSAEAFAIRYLFPLTGAVLPLIGFGAIWLVIASIASSYASRSVAAAMGLVGTGVAALVVFGGFTAAPWVGRWSILLLPLLLLLLCTLPSGSAQRRLKQQTDDFAKLCYVWALAGIGLVALGAAGDNGGDVWGVNALFSPIEFSTDNQLPVRVARALSSGIPPSQITFGQWLASDRTPLLSGYLLALYGLWPSGFLFQLDYALDIAHQASGAVIMALWAPLTWVALRLAGVSEKHIVVVVVTLGFTGFCIFNGLYLSPKLLSGGFGILMILALASLSSFDRKCQAGSQLLAIAAVSGALSLLSHSGAMFGIAAALLVCSRSILRQGIVSPAIAAGLGLLTLSPWIIWQNFIQPHGNALLRFLLVGRFGFENREASILAEVTRAYSALSLDQFLSMKWQAIRTMFGYPVLYCNNIQTLGYSWLSAPIETLMVNETYYLSAAAAIPVIFGLLASYTAPTPLALPTRVAVRTLAWVGVLSVAASVLISWDAACQILYHFSFPAALALMIAGWIAVVAHGWTWVAIFSIGLGLAAWVASPVAKALTIRWAWVAVLALAVGAMLALLASALASERSVARRQVQP